MHQICLTLGVRVLEVGVLCLLLELCVSTFLLLFKEEGKAL